MWDGPSFSNGDFMWYGYEVGSDLAKIAATTCDENGECIPDGREQLHAMYQGFILRDLSTNITKVTHEEFDYMFRTLQRIFSSSMAATDPDLADFKNAGGKMITYHGLASTPFYIYFNLDKRYYGKQADEAITPASTLKYYKQVMKLDNATSDFFRYYRIPGLAHCWGGAGGQPGSMFDQLRLWVENGTAPEASPVKIQQSGNTTRDEIICPYPKKATFEKACTNSTSTAECWSCE
ncbi:tannase and feruloyl esterase-domain-containing protein [Daldinia loculata]|uniref:tannase and feruloyl esterase-domain-containing protein n=1 Tax=Daldinia loculata TaxID=103429 RepID=UPI0020C27AAD|nr:tannase and feruloyl esterase-domain-containing protein [Daldinia loculata]KAI1647739.1 tannase and feruloyl esterase-domain-containing protein [Daldinia loculata]